MPSSGVLGNSDWSPNTTRAPMPKSVSLPQSSCPPNDVRCAGPAAGRGAGRRCAAASTGTAASAATSTALPISFRIGSSLPAKGDGRKEEARKTAHRYKRRADLSRDFGSVGDDPHRVPHYLEEAARHVEAARGPALADDEVAPAQQGEERRVSRQHADLAVKRRGDDRLRDAIEYGALGGDDRDVHHSGRGQALRLLDRFVDPRHHVEGLLGELVELARHDALE